MNSVIFSRSASAVIDQPDSRPVYRTQRSDPVEEPTEYRGYTNPNVQSRSFKILQESLSYSEANEEGIVLPTGNTPGEGIVHRAYYEGRRRLEELSEINPRNFTTDGESPYRVSEHYNIKEESLISEQSVPNEASVTVAAAKVYDGSEPKRRQRPTVNMAQSSVLSPVAGQQQYIQQAHEYYERKPEPEPHRRERPTVNIAHSSVLSPAAGQQQYLQQAQEHYARVESEPQYHSRREPVPQKAVVHRQRPKDRQLKLVNYQFDEQYGHLKKESSSVQAQQQGQVMQTSRQKAVVSPQKSGDFIPATQMVESVAADLHLKIVSPGVAPQQAITTKTNSELRGKQVITLGEQMAKPATNKEIIRIAEPVVQSVQQTVKTTEQVIKPIEQTAKPTEEAVKTVEQTYQSNKSTEQAFTVVEKSSELKDESMSANEGRTVEETTEKGKVVQADNVPEDSKQNESSKVVIDEAVNKFAEELSASVVASARQCVQAPKEAEKMTLEEHDGSSISREISGIQVQAKVESEPTQVIESPTDQQIQHEKQQVQVKVSESVEVEVSSSQSSEQKVISLTKEPIQVEEAIKEEETEQVSIDEPKSDQQENIEVNQAVETDTVASIVVEEEKPSELTEVSETIPTVVEEGFKQTEEVNVVSSVNEVKPAETENKDSVSETQEQASLTVKEVTEQASQSESKTVEVTQTTVVKEVDNQSGNKSAEVIQTSEVKTVIRSEQNETESSEQTVNIATNVESEEHSFSISVGENMTTEETVSESADLTFEVSANETDADSSAAFEISTDAAISLDVSSDIQFTTDVSADVTTDVSTDSDAAVTIALESSAEEIETADVTLSVDESLPEAKQPEKVKEPVENKQNGSKPTKAKFVDSQGGIAARLARLKQK